MYVRQQIDQRLAEIQQARSAFIALAERHANAPFPGYTHLQRAQPLLFAHWCLAYVEMLNRDAQRFADARLRVNQCPLGAGALAGTAYPIDRVKLALALGFNAPTANSLDAVSDRDFALETLSAAAITSLHLSRLAEDLIIYSSAEFGLVELSDAFTSGSSLMPQKKNPDALELIRGKSSRIVSAFTTLAITLKGLPLSYNKDLQEDKPPLFDAMEQLSMCLRVLPPLLEGLQLNREKALAAARAGHSNATDLADYLVEKGIPFREAHEITGRIVRFAIDHHTNLEDLTLEQLQTFAPQISEDVRVRLTIDSMLNRRDVIGGTAPARVRQALKDAKDDLKGGEPPARGNPHPRVDVHVRQATLDDLDAIGELVEYWARQGENLPRTPQTILEAIADFGVAVADGTIIGCGSLSIYTPALAEIRSLGIDSQHHGHGAGAKLVRYFLARARALHVPKVFALTRVPAFFEKLGFHMVDIATLPEKARKDCCQCPKRENCDEIAMVHHTFGDQPAPTVEPKKTAETQPSLA